MFRYGRAAYRRPVAAKGRLAWGGSVTEQSRQLDGRLRWARWMILLTADFTTDLDRGALPEVVSLVRERLTPEDVGRVEAWLEEALLRANRREAAATEELEALELAEQLTMKYGAVGDIPLEDVQAVEDRFALAESLGSIDLMVGVPADYRLDDGRRVSATTILADEDLQASFLHRAEGQLLAWARRPLVLERRGADLVRDRLGLVLWAVRQLMAGAS
jgi:hypothetical protein